MTAEFEIMNKTSVLVPSAILPEERQTGQAIERVGLRVASVGHVELRALDSIRSHQNLCRNAVPMQEWSRATGRSSSLTESGTAQHGSHRGELDLPDSLIPLHRAPTDQHQLRDVRVPPR